MTTRHETFLKAVIVLAITLVVPRARADDKQTCTDAYKEAQVARDAHELIRARDELRVCGRASCAPFIVKDCTEWLDQVTTALPSVVVTMKSAQGGDVVYAKVTIDGGLVSTTLDGRAIDVDSGPHLFAIDLPSGKRFEQRVVVKEGVHRQQISFGEAPATSSAMPPSPSLPLVSTDTTSTASGPTGMRVAGYVLGGAGILGLAVGSVFGLFAIRDNNAAGCDAGNVCKDAPNRKDAQGAATASTIGFVAGGVVLAGGVALVLLSPSARSAGKRAGVPIRATPFLARGAGGLMVGGGF